ncbi:hypothetical protein HPC49_49655 [Pyxidicoccus fallax]|uniref:Porin n=2 Tax=Pyxidicoccus fallax TaxID=394095 RepID=A0A848M1R1_9BACT|nr:hypothetical protein [Pyxidicoccus fallax]NMO23294.1 hypothetical protein [Pyxidicoccus fallax]NPC86243.1 hypothetical protein [Pyxidicoccus fallax]
MLAAPAAQAATVWEPGLRLTAEERYDDDLRLGDGAAGGQLMTKLSPRLSLTGKDGRLDMESFYAADFLMRHGSGKLSLDHRAGVELRHVLSRRLRVDSAARVFRVRDPASLPRDGLARTTSPTFFTQATLGVTGRATERLDVRAGYKFEAVRILAAGQNSGYAHTPSLEAWYRGTRRLSLGLEYRYQGFLYQGELGQSHGVAAGLRYRLTRPTTFIARAGPVRFLAPEGQQSGWAPRVHLELQRDGELLDVGVAVGHDLVGASGFANAVWADYASVVFGRRFTQRFNAFGAASFFRNGRAPAQQWGVFNGSPDVSQGYALSGGVEYRIDRRFMVQGAVDRIAQVGVPETAGTDGTGAETPGAADLTRNVFAVRLVVTPW